MDLCWLSSDFANTLYSGDSGSSVGNAGYQVETAAGAKTYEWNAATNGCVIAAANFTYAEPTVTLDSAAIDYVISETSNRQEQTLVAQVLDPFPSPGLWQTEDFALSAYWLNVSNTLADAWLIDAQTNGFYQEGLVPQMNSRILPVISNIIVTRKLTKDEIDLHQFKTFSPIANTKNLLYYYRKLPDNRILFGTRGDLIGSDQSNLDRSKIMEKFLKNIFPNWTDISIEYNWRGLIAMSQKLTPSIGKIENEEIYYGFGYHGVGVSSAPWTGKQLSKLVFSSNSKNLNISNIYKGLPKKFIFPKLRIFYFRLAVLFYNIKDKLNI